MTEQERIRVFEDTEAVIRQSSALAGATLRAQAESRIYLPGFEDLMPETRSRNAPVTVTEDTTFHCALQLAQEGKRTAVLNFANAFSPGGNVREGVDAQEEALCRCSNLYDVLTVPYLMRNYYRHNEKTAGAIGTDALIYSPGITVIKSDDPLPVLLPEPFQVDVITCAAPYYDPQRRKKISPEKLESILRARIRNILEVASARRADMLVLGAFGCGAFQNPPEMVAEVFRWWLVERGFRDRFERVVFAVKPDRARRNVDAFRAAFADQ